MVPILLARVAAALPRFSQPKQPLLFCCLSSPLSLPSHPIISQHIPFSNIHSSFSVCFSRQWRCWEFSFLLCPFWLLLWPLWHLPSMLRPLLLPQLQLVMVYIIFYMLLFFIFQYVNFYDPILFWVLLMMAIWCVCRDSCGPRSCLCANAAGFGPHLHHSLDFWKPGKTWIIGFIYWPCFPFFN